MTKTYSVMLGALYFYRMRDIDDSGHPIEAYSYWLLIDVTPDYETIYNILNGDKLRIRMPLPPYGLTLIE